MPDKAESETDVPRELPQALSGARVVELSSGIAAAFAGRILGDLGAHVVLVEPPGGLLRRGPTSTNPLFVYYDASKSSRCVALDTAAGLEDLHQLLAGSDILLTDRPGVGTATGALSAEQLHAANPALIIARVTPFGDTGPYADFAATHLVQCALAGWAAACGTPEKGPLQSGGDLTAATAGAYTAIGVLGALLARDTDGRGDVVDVSTWEAAITGAFCPTLLYEYRGDLPTHDSTHATGPSFHIPCRGGYVGVNVLTDAQWEMTCLFIERADLAADPRYATAGARAQRVPEIEAVLTEALGDRDAGDVFRTAQEWRLPFGLVVTPSQALQLDTHRARSYLQRCELPGGAVVQLPRMPFLMSATPTRATPPPTLDDAAGAAPAQRLPAPTSERERSAPLAGIRIIDFTAFQAGPMATLIAADLGAEVIKIEAVQRLDGWRGIGRGEHRPWETSGPFHWANRGKRGITLNLADPRGVELTRRLIDHADVVVENFTPRVMRQHGLSFEELHRRHPDLIMVSMPGYGSQGPWSEHASFAYPAEQLSTISHQTGHADGPPLFTGTPICDAAAALMASNGLLAAIRHHRQTGEGQHIDVSQLEAATSLTGEALIAAQLTGDDSERRGNHHPAMAPHGIYPCRDSRWIAIACRDDDDWTNLLDHVDASTRTRCRAGWGQTHQRLADREALDAVIAAWTARSDAPALMATLQGAGIPAGTVMNGADLLADEHLHARGFYVAHHNPESGTTHCPAQPFRYAITPLAPPRNAPLLGEHNREVLHGLLGLSDDELAALEHDLVIGTEPLHARAI